MVRYPQNFANATRFLSTKSVLFLHTYIQNALMNDKKTENEKNGQILSHLLALP